LAGTPSTVTLHMNSIDITNLLTAICANYNYAQNNGGLSQGQFALNQMVAWFNSQFAEYNATLAQQAGTAAVAAAAAGQTSLALAQYNPFVLNAAITATQP
jgi:hypothetical protein